MGLRPIGAQIVRAARTVAHLALLHATQRVWITAADLCRALPDLCGRESAAGMQLHRAYEAGLLRRQTVARAKPSSGGIRYGYRPTLLLAAYELPEPESTEEGGNVQ